MKYLCSSTSSACAVLLISINSLSAATFTYQGWLDRGEVPFHGPVTIEFELHTSESGGSKLGPTISQILQVDQGLLQTQLDFDTHAFETGLWLEISVNGQTLPQRQAIDLAPLAAKALDAVEARNAIITDSNGGFAIMGSLNTGVIPKQGSGTRLMWYPGKAAFRAGNVTGTQWDEANTGTPSIALGENTRALGDYSIAIGNHQSTARGERDIAIGRSATASPSDEFELLPKIAIGSSSSATAGGSIAIGRFAQAFRAPGYLNGNNSPRAIGGESKSGGINSTAFSSSSSIGIGSTSFGLGNNTGRFADTVVVGRYNWLPSGLPQYSPFRPLFVVGNGAGGNLSNAMWLRYNGDLFIAGTLTQNSDRHKKHGITPVYPVDILKRLDRIEIFNWRYNHNPGVPHIGPMAQDFHAAFGVGEDGTGISLIDSSGVALAAIQGLFQLSRTLDQQIDDQELALTDHRDQWINQQQEQESRLTALEALLSETIPAKVSPR